MKIVLRAEVHIEVPREMEAEAKRAHETGETIMAFSTALTQQYGRKTMVIVDKCELRAE